MTWSLPLSCVCIAVLTLACGSTPTEAERREDRLDQTPVHFHVALRAQLDGPDGAQTAESLVEAPASRSQADRLAREVFSNRLEGRSRLRRGHRPAVTWSSLRAPGASVGADSDAAALFLALLSEDSVNDSSIPDLVLVYQASELRPDGIQDPVLRRLTRASRALVFARAGYCQQAEREAATVAATSLQSAEIDALQEWLGDLPDPSTTTDDLERAAVVLAGAAQACCFTARNDDDAASVSISGWIDDAEHLGVSPNRVALLRGWAALAAGDESEARAQLTLAQEGKADMDISRYTILRDALASNSDSQALERASRQLFNQRWLSRVVLRGVRRAFEEDGLIAALDQHPETRAMREFAAGYVAVIRAVRVSEPMFDHAYKGDHDSFERLSLLFRGR